MQFDNRFPKIMVKFPMKSFFIARKKISGSIKRGQFLDQLRDYQLLKKDCATWSWMVSSGTMIKGEKYIIMSFIINLRTYCSRNIIRMIKSRRMRWMGLVARIG
jgi:hypothetical protein